jgi:outer membrane immunogenic protein
MRKVLACGISAAALTIAAPALGADLSGAPPLMKAPMAPVSDWTGFYVGVNGGWGRSNPTSEPAFSATGLTLVPIFSAPQLSGWVFGGHAGFNWQTGMFVGGLEVDVDAADIKENQSTFVGVVNVTRSVTINDLGSARARLGFVPTPWLMLYGTGGIGWANSTVKCSFTVPLFGSVSDEADQNHVGWVAGAGAETKFGDHVLLRAEWLHYGFGTQSIIFPTSAVLLGQGVLLDGNAKIAVDVVRGGLSWKL